MRYWGVVVCMAGCLSWPACGAEVARTAVDGRSLFAAGEFKKAVRAFEQALAGQPENPAIHFWLGNSFARLAEISSPLAAPKRARLARIQLEQAVRMNPERREYWRELFEFYVDSPEWFHGGLRRAEELLGHNPESDTIREELRSEIAASRSEHSGAAWGMRRALLWTSAAVGELLP